MRTPALLVLAAAAAAAASPQVQCLLVMRLFPLEYHEKVNTLQTKVHFESNCMPYLHAQYFVIPAKLYYQAMTLEAHPRLLDFTVLGTNVSVRYSAPADQPDKKWVLRRYTAAEVRPGNFAGEELDVAGSNFVLVKPGGARKFYAKRELITLWNSVNPGKCSVQDGLKSLVCIIAAGQQVVRGY